MALTDYERRGMRCLPSQVWRPIVAAERAFQHRKRRPNAFLEKLATAVQALNDFAGVHVVYKESVRQRMTDAGVTPDYPEPELAWGEMSEGARESLNHALDKCDAVAYSIGNARRLLARLEREA